MFGIGGAVLCCVIWLCCYQCGAEGFCTAVFVFSSGSGGNKFCIILNSHPITYVSRFHRQIRLMILISQMEKRFVLYSVRIWHKITKTKSQTVDCVALHVIIYIPIIFGIFVPAFGSHYTGCWESECRLQSRCCFTFCAYNSPAILNHCVLKFRRSSKNELTDSERRFVLRDPGFKSWPKDWLPYPIFRFILCANSQMLL